MATILVIDDSDAARREIRSVLDESGLFTRVLEASDGMAGLRMMLSESVDLVLCDLEMPGLDGEKLLRARGMRDDCREVPFLFLTANRDAERAARLLRAGANDTIAKPFHASELVARLELHLRVTRLQSELRDKNARLERTSTVDPVTGLRTRRYVMEVLSLEVLRAIRYHTPLTLLMADLDHFKRVNDEHGHPAGDAVLRHIGGIFGGGVRGTDVAGRYGGEELLVVLPQTRAAGGAALGERLRQAVESAEIRIPSGDVLQVTASVGVATLIEPMDEPAALLEAADAALYAAKEAGRNRVVAAGNASGLDTGCGNRKPEIPGPTR